MTHQDIIRLMGGPIALARGLGLERPAVALHWPARGIPSRFWHHVVNLANERGVIVTFAVLEAGKPTRREAA